MRIILTGGGTGGSVMPLIAIYQKINELYPRVDFLFIGTRFGPEKTLAESRGLDFKAVPAGKWRRYFSWHNLLSPFMIIAGFIKSLFIIKDFNPDAVIGAGSYVSVPVIIAAFIMRKKILIHQQDVLPTFSNQLIAPLADKITVSFESSIADFYSGSGLFRPKKSNKIIWTGNPVLSEIAGHYNQKDIISAKKKFGISDQLPVILMMGGATGALAINQLILAALPELVKFAHIIHSSGRAKTIAYTHPHYHQFELILNIADAYHSADIVVCRAGLSTITDLSIMSKPSIVIPMPHSHQTANASALERLGAAIILDQASLNVGVLVSSIKKLLYDGALQNQLKKNIATIMPKNAAEKIAKLTKDLCAKN